MARKLPPLNPLRTFEAAARLGSFTRAADELLVTQSAVSRQIGVLEDYLGIALFLRDAKGVQLTAAGQQYHGEIGPAFQLLTTATERLRKSASGAPLKIRVYATFAAKWLMRRLPQFQELNPDISVRISTAVAPVDFARDGVDAAIQLGRGEWPGSNAVLLFADDIAPVCAPRLVAGATLPLSLSVLGRFRLLHSHYRRSDWPDWLASVGEVVAEDVDPITFPSSLLTYQAAIDGLGVAMGQLPLLADELSSGALVRPFAHSLRRGLAYYLVVPGSAGQRQAEGLRLFSQWLLAECGAG